MIIPNIGYATESRVFPYSPLTQRLFPKQWYLIPPLPERSMSEWPPVSQKPEDPEHESKLEAVLNTVGRDSVDDAVSWYALIERTDLL